MAADLHLYDSQDNALRRAGYAAEYCDDYSIWSGVCLADRPNVRHAGVDSIAQVAAWIESIGRAERTLNRLIFHTHGAPGYVHLPNGGISDRNVGTLKTGCETYLAMGADVLFLGCNVGEGSDGETFLRAAGIAMLSHGGGRVIACDSVTFSVPGLGQRWPAWASARIATVRRGGAVSVL